ncbi:l-fucose operon activator [Photorhabdus temperata subsp. temperata M1021]|nr:l-fucose operon activator [Photorhabdus temperata subsp. temperata M1021]
MQVQHVGIWQSNFLILISLFLPIAFVFVINYQRKKNIQLISSGGILHRKYACYISSSLIAQLKNLEVDLFIFSCDGIDADGDLWDSNIDNAQFKDILIKRALQSILLIDKSKVNRKSEIKIGNRSNITDIISNY